MSGLYAIVDVDSLRRAGLPVLEFAEAVASERPDFLQLRAKHATAREALALLRALAPICARHSVPLFNNDRADLAALAGCAGVHLGQEDLPIGEVRRCFPQLLLGYSTHSLPQLESALSERPDYVAFGPIFETQSKQGADPAVGLEELGKAAHRAGECPLVAIGGIDEARAADVARRGAIAAVISALIPDSGRAADVRDKVRALRRALEGAA